MNPFWQEVERIRIDLMPFARSLEVRARRFLAAYIPALITVMVTVPSASFTPAFIWSTSLSVAITVLGELDPSIPWSILTRRLDLARHRDPVVTPPTKNPTP